jgi:hypothetical protein
MKTKMSKEKVLTKEEKSLIKTVLEISPKGGWLRMTLVRKLYRANIGVETGRKKERQMLVQIFSIMQFGRHCFRFERGHEDYYLYISPIFVTRLSKLIDRRSLPIHSQQET